MQLERITNAVRPREGRVIAGVCAAVAREFKIDVSMVRLVWIGAALMSMSLGFWLYIAAWLVLPGEGSEHRGIDQLKEQFESYKARKTPGDQQQPGNQQQPGDQSDKNFNPYQD